MFETAPELQTLLESAARFARERYDLTGSAPVPFSAERWSEMAELGWLAAIVSEDHGGLGLDLAAISELAETIAGAVMPEPLLSQLALGGFVLDHAASTPERDGCLEAWIAGTARVALAHHERRDWPCFGAAVTTQVREHGEELVINGSKRAVLAGDLASHFIVSARSADEHNTVALLVAADAAGLEVRAYPTFDGRTLADLELEHVRVAVTARLDFAHPTLAHIEQGLILLALFEAAESLGLARALFDMTHAYLAERKQFGNALVDFQVLQHRLVDMQLAVTRLESQLVLARHKVNELGLEQGAAYISAAAVQAGAVGRTVAQQAVQLHGAIGMTDELLVGRYFKRLTANALTCGSAGEHLQRFAHRRGGR